MPRSNSKVIVYSASWCPYCHAIMAWLDDLGVKYQEIDAEKLLDSNELQSIPATKIAKNIIYGFDRPAILKALKESHNV